MVKTTTNFVENGGADKVTQFETQSHRTKFKTINFQTYSEKKNTRMACCCVLCKHRKLFRSSQIILKYKLCISLFRSFSIFRDQGKGRRLFGFID